MKALASQWISTDSPERSLLANVISTEISCIGLYCRFGNFPENFIFANSIKRQISDVKYLQLRQDLPISINDRVILPFR